MGVMDYRVRAGAAGVVYEYNVPYSCQFRDGASGGKLTRTQGTPTGSKAFTYSFWFKGKTDMAGLNDNKDFTFLDASSTDNDFISMGRLNGKFSFALRGGTGDGGYLVTSEELRDPGAWYHMVIAVNTEESTASDRMRMYKNGTEITSFSTETNCAEDYVLQNFNTSGVSLRVGQEAGSYPGSAYMAETHFIDGQQLTPSSFGETNSDTNQWEAKTYTGNYGDNGFYLKFQDSSNLGDDSSGEGNDFTVANLTANNQVGDGPKTSDAALGSTSAGGNWCTLNPLDTGDNGSWNGDLEDGNLKLAGTAGVVKSRASFALDTTNGSYWEVRWGASTDANCGISRFTQDNLNTSSQVGAGSALETGYKGSTGVVDTNGSTEATYATSAEGTIVSFAYKAGRLYVGKVASASAAPTWFNSGDPAAGTGYVNSVVKPDADYWAAACGISHTVNFGQDSSFGGEETAQGNTDINGYGDFWGTVPTGYLALCNTNLADPSIVLPSDHFNTIIWSGAQSGSSAPNRAMTGVGFKPDMVFGKSRVGANQGQMVFAGTTSTIQDQLIPDGNNTQGYSNGSGIVYSLDTDGFTTKAGSSGVINWDESGRSYVAWNWLAGGPTTATNTSGSIDTEVTANTTAGFSIISYTGDNGASATLGHGLSQAPELVIVKGRNVAESWYVGSSAPEMNFTLSDYMTLNTDGGESSSATIWNDTAPTASVFTVGTNDAVNGSYNYMALCWHSIEGYSKVGGYTGNGNANGPFIYTGFRPAWAMCKRINDSQSWLIFDDVRNTYNQMDRTLRADTTGIEQSIYYMDMVSNGIKIREGSSIFNHDGGTYLLLAFAESPFKTSNAR